MAEVLVQKMIQTRTEDGASERYIADLRSRLGRFGKAFKTPISSITTQDLDNWLRGLKINPRNRRNFRTLLVALFNFAREQGYLPKHLTTAADDLSMPKVKPSAIKIYTPKEILKLLLSADEEIKPFLAFGAFAGLRSAEIERLTWENIKWEQGVVVVNAEWLVLSGMYEWQEPEFRAFQLSVQGQLKMFTHVRSWIVETRLLDDFLVQTKNLHFWGNGCDLITGEGWTGEYPWGAPFAMLERSCSIDTPWLEGVNVEYAQTVCRADSSERMIVPSPQLCRALQIQWSGEASDFVDSNGELVVTQMDTPTAFGQRPCLLRRSYLSATLSKMGLSLVWGIVGERTCYSDQMEEYVVAKQGEFSGIYHIQNARLKGGITRHLVRPFPINPQVGQNS